jgi:hypothetical protein
MKKSSSMTFHAVFGIATAAAQAYKVNATGLGAISTRFASEADGWGLYRVKAFRFRLLPSSAAAGQSGGLAPVCDTLPSTSANILELNESVYIPPAQVVPTQWVRASRTTCAGPMAWYKTFDGASDTSEETPFYFVYIQGAAVLASIELFITVEFKMPVAPANTPAQLQLLHSYRKARLEQAASARRNLLLASLAPTAQGAISSSAMVANP